MSNLYTMPNDRAHEMVEAYRQNHQQIADFWESDPERLTKAMLAGKPKPRAVFYERFGIWCLTCPETIPKVTLAAATLNDALEMLVHARNDPNMRKHLPREKVNGFQG